MKPDLLLTYDRDLLTKFSKTLSILSKEDNLKILNYAREIGLKAEYNTFEALQISKRVYYTRLKELIKSGLLQKVENSYVLTTLGKMVYKNCFSILIDQLNLQREMEMIDILKQNKAFEEDEIMRFISKISKTDLAHDSNFSKNIEFVWSYEAMISAIVERLDKCKNRIYLCSKYFDEVIINNIIRKHKTGLDVKIIADVNLVKKFLNQDKKGIAIIDKNSIERTKLVSNPWYPENIDRKINRVPFSFIIFDEHEVGIELINSSNANSFYGTFFIEDTKSSRIMLQIFNNLFNSAFDLNELIQKN